MPRHPIVRPGRRTAVASVAVPAVLAVLAALGACTLAPGDWFAELDASLDARYVLLPDRDAGDGWQRLDTDYQARVDEASITIDSIELLDIGGAATTFDPANPPPGYSLCHNGHCHHESGELVPYEEIERELSGADGPVAVVALPVGEVDLEAGFSGPLSCVPRCGLPLSDVRTARAGLLRFALEGRVRDGRVPPRIGETPFTVELELAGKAAAPPDILEAPIALPVDRRHAPDVDLDFVLHVAADLLDGIDFAALATSGGTVDFALPDNQEERESIRLNLLETPFEGHVTRTGGRP